MLSEVGPIILDFRSEKSFTLTDIRSSTVTVLCINFCTHTLPILLLWLCNLRIVQRNTNIYLQSVLHVIVNNHKNIGKIKEF